MSRPERTRPIRLNQGSTGLAIEGDKARIVTRGNALDFNTIEDLELFANELNILMVMLTSEMEANPRDSKPDDQEQPT